MIDTTKSNVPDGFILLQTQNGTPKYAACMTGRLAGWLMKRYPDGNWVSERRLTNLEVMQAEDQRDDGIVHETPTATIQEPVMVAEPVAEFAAEVYTAMRCFDGAWGQGSNEMRRSALEAEASRLMRAPKPAAPMVADPAGVAAVKQIVETLQLVFSKIDPQLSGDQFQPILKEVQMAIALAATVKAVPKIRITLRQARLLVDFFGGHDADVTVTERPAEWEQVEEGLYAFCTEYPEEGAQFLGVTETDDELMRLGTVKAVPSEALDPSEVQTIAERIRNSNFAAPLTDKTGGGE